MSDFPVKSVGINFIASLGPDYAKFILEYGIQQMVPNGQYFKLLPEGRSPAEPLFQPHSH